MISKSKLSQEPTGSKKGLHLPPWSWFPTSQTWIWLPTQPAQLPTHNHQPTELWFKEPITTNQKPSWAKEPIWRSLPTSTTPSTTLQLETCSSFKVNFELRRRIFIEKKNKFVNIFPNSFQHRGESVDLSPRQWQGIEELLLDTCKRLFSSTYSEILRSRFQARSLFIIQSIRMKRNFFELRMGNCKKLLFLLNFLSCFAFQLLCNSFSG